MKVKELKKYLDQYDNSNEKGITRFVVDESHIRHLRNFISRDGEKELLGDELLLLAEIVLAKTNRSPEQLSGRVFIALAHDIFGGYANLVELQEKGQLNYCSVERCMYLKEINRNICFFINNNWPAHYAHELNELGRKSEDYYQSFSFLQQLQLSPQRTEQVLDIFLKSDSGAFYVSILSQVLKREKNLARDFATLLELLDVKHANLIWAKKYIEKLLGRVAFTEKIIQKCCSLIVHGQFHEKNLSVFLDSDDCKSIDPAWMDDHFANTKSNTPAQENAEPSIEEKKSAPMDKYRFFITHRRHLAKVMDELREKFQCPAASILKS